MDSRETTVGIVFIGLALLCAFVAIRLDAPDWAPVAVLVGVGVLWPQLLNGYLDSRGVR
jgi:hypothetical protein